MRSNKIECTCWWPGRYKNKTSILQKKNAAGTEGRSRVVEMATFSSSLGLGLLLTASMFVGVSRGIVELGEFPSFRNECA